MNLIISCGFLQSVLVMVTCLTPKPACNKSETTVSGSNAPKSFCSGDLIFEDDFKILNTSVWTVENNLAIGLKSKQFQSYVNDPKNAFVDKYNIFHIKPSLTADIYGEKFLTTGNITIPKNECTQSWIANGCNKTGTKDNPINPIRSARIHTKQSFSFKYGTVEIRAKLPTGDWLFPALWMLPHSSVYGKWPMSGEIDIMEGRGNREFFSGKTNVGVTQVVSTLHYGPKENVDEWRYTRVGKSDSKGFNASFHTFKLRWTPKSLQFFVDGKSIGAFNASKGFFHLGKFDSKKYTNPWASSSSLLAPFDQEFYIILNLAVGGIFFFSDANVNKPLKKPWLNTSKRPMADFWEHKNQWLPTWKLGSHFLIDYVRVWAL